MLAVQPTVEMAKRNSKQRIDPLIEESAALRELVSDPRSRDSGNTMLAKEFPGGILVMTGANSAVGLRSMAARYLFCDEVDAYPGDVDGEGDPVNLALARTRTFARRKVFMISTPKIAGRSRIEAAFEDSDQRWYWVPCPHCLQFQTLEFAQIRWPKDEPERAAYICKHCEGAIDNHQKHWMLPRGEWRPVAPGQGKPAGFRLSSLYSPVGWFSWADAAQMFVAAQKDTALLQVFVNTVLGETWRERGDAPDWKRLFDRREDYRLGTVPEGVRILTAGADVQADRIEVQIVGWGRNKESWLVDYLVLYGDTARPEVWVSLTSVLGTVYEDKANREFTLKKLAVDSGFASQQVYAWARQHRYGPVQVIKGGPASAQFIVGPQSPVEITVNGKRLKSGIQIQLVNVSELKKQFYGWLHQQLPNREKGEAYPEGFFHFCSTPDSEEYCKQLTAEQLVTRTHKGYQKREWEKIRPRNEALDTWLYAKTAAMMIGLEKYKDAHWDRLEKALGIEQVVPVVALATPIASTATAAVTPKRAWRVAPPTHQFGRTRW